MHKWISSVESQCQFNVAIGRLIISEGVVQEGKRKQGLAVGRCNRHDPLIGIQGVSRSSPGNGQFSQTQLSLYVVSFGREHLLKEILGFIYLSQANANAGLQIAEADTGLSEGPGLLNDCQSLIVFVEQVIGLGKRKDCFKISWSTFECTLPDFDRLEVVAPGNRGPALLIERSRRLRRDVLRN